MKNLTTWILVAIASPLFGQMEQLNPGLEALEGPQLGERILGIASNDSPLASDFEYIARETLKLGQAGRAQGQDIEKSAIHDAIDAVTAGESIEPNHTDWLTLRNELEALLEPPPEQENQDQNQQDQQDQDQENQDQNEQNQDQNQQSDNQDSQNQDQNQNQQDSQQNSSDQNQDQESQQQQESEQEQQESEQQEGEQNEEEQSSAQQEQQNQEEETQEIGGTKLDENQELTPEEVRILQMMEELSEKDRGGLMRYLMMQAERENEGEEIEGAPDNKQTKDW